MGQDRAMRNTIVGIIIGVVVGVMIGATVVAPRLEEARTAPSSAPPSSHVSTSQATSVRGVETLGLKQPFPNKSTKPLQAPATRLRIISLYPAKMPVLGELAQRLKRMIPAATGGRLGITMFDPGTLVAKEDTLDAVSSGTIDGVFATPDHWGQDIPALQLFTAIPFGPDAQEHLAWFYQGGGRQLFETSMNKKGVHATLCGAIPPEASGWYRKPVRSADDFKDLNIRAVGLAGAVLTKLGAKVQNLDAGGVLAQFELGTLDAAQYSLPSVDAQLGFQKFARNYYFPGWQRPVTLFALMLNAKVWQSLPATERTAIQSICGDNVRYALALADAQQFEALKELGLAGVQVRRWPDNVLQSLRSAWKEVVREQAQNDDDFSKAWNSLQKFRRDYAIWYEISRF
ncbi:MAG: TRAP transporter substrate-binding protein [Magnetovibrio sp.]|nr:TRAP transporter substrate-binding protein [Magnetovibrio sp.]